MNVGQTRRFWHRLLKPALFVVVLGLVATSLFGIWSFIGKAGERPTEFAYYTVARSDMPIIITERGNVGAQKVTEIQCEVETMVHNTRAVQGTQIVFIVPNGSVAKKGDLLVELESSAIREHMYEHVLSHYQAVSFRIQQTAIYENRLIQNETNLALAKLRVQLAEKRLQMYLDEESGTYRLARDEGLRDILEKRVALAMAETEQNGNEQLFNLGYCSRGQLDRARYRRMQAQDDLASSVSKQKQLDAYESKMQRMRLEGALASANRFLKQVVNDNAALLLQADAAKRHAERMEKRMAEILDRMKLQVEKCKIFAPHDGMVVYFQDGYHGSSIAEGALVYRYQTILTLPDPSRMQVKTEIHEAVLDQVRPKMSAKIRIDACPGKVFTGSVYEVAVLPTTQSYGWLSTGVKTYQTVVRIDGDVSHLRPGMTAVVEIEVDPIKDALTVPVQAIVQRDRDNWCYVSAPGGVEKRTIQLGKSNGEFVHVRDGLSDGDRVVLNPASLVELENTGDKEISPVFGAPDVPTTIASSDDVQVEHKSENVQVRAKDAQTVGG